MTSSTKDVLLFDETIQYCSSLLEQGMRKMVANLSEKPLSEYAVFGPADVSSSITFQLMQDVRASGFGLDILESYTEYLQLLVSEFNAFHFSIADIGTI